MRDPQNIERTVVGVFADRDDARDAAQTLSDAGYGHPWVAVTRAADASATAYTSPGSTGTVVDDADMLSKIGRFFSGEGATSLAAALRNHGVSDAEADRLERSVPAGRTILTVSAHSNTSSGADTPAAIIERCGGRVMTADFSDESLYDATARSDASTADEQQRLRLREERLSVGKEQVSSGEARVRKEVVEQRQTVDVPTYHEELYVERRAVGDTTAAAGPMEGETIRIPLTEERLVVEKRPVTTEEVVIGKRRVTDTQHVSETTRKEVLNVDDDATRSKSSKDAAAWDTRDDV